MKINYHLRFCIVFIILFTVYSSVIATPGGLYTGNELRVDAGPGLHSPSHVGDPICIYNGNNIQTQKDLVFPTPDHRGFAFTRSYNSQSNKGVALVSAGLIRIWLSEKNFKTMLR